MNERWGVTGVSVVIPVYNGAGSLRLLVEKLHQALSVLDIPYEVVLVNDHSRDESWIIIDELCRQHPWLVGIDLMRNYGQHNALLCGIRAARNAVIVTLDDDLQHDPDDIRLLLQTLESTRSDVVYGIPERLRNEPWRNFTSTLSKELLARTMDVPSIRQISAFRAFRSSLRDAFVNFEGPDVLIDSLLAWGTTDFSSVVIRHSARFTGRSNYNFGRLLNHFMLILTGFSTKPLRYTSVIGFFFTGLGLIELGYVLVQYIRSSHVEGFAFLASSLALFSGAQLFALGVMGEYLARMFGRTIDRPTYVVRERLHAQGTEGASRS